MELTTKSRASLLDKIDRRRITRDRGSPRGSCCEKGGEGEAFDWEEKSRLTSKNNWARCCYPAPSGASSRRVANSNRSFPDERSASQLSLLALITARDPYADVLRVIEHVIGWRRRVLIENKLSLEDAAFGRVRAGEIRVRAAS